jgi:transposase
LVQRVEIITGREGRRRWSEDERRRLAAEAFAPGAVAAHVARRHGVAESCLYAWRKRFGGAAGSAVADQARLIPVMVGGVAARTPAAPPMALRSHQAVVMLPDGTRLEIDAGYPTARLKALIAALRAAR